MFDTIHPVTRVYETRNTTINEHRAPTDESVRLLREMERKAQEQVIQAVRVENTPIDSVIHSIREHGTGDTLWRCIFKVNGKQLQADYIQRFEEDRQTIANGIRDAIAKQVANVIAGQALSAMSKFDQFNRLKN